MNNKGLLYLLLLFTFQLAAQDPDPSGIYSIEEVTINGATKDEIYDQALFWFAKTFQQNIAKVVSIDDKEKGLIFGTAEIDYRNYSDSNYSPTAGYISYHIKIEVRDGGYKVSYYDFTHFGNDAATVTASYGLITPDDYCNSSKLKLSSKRKIYSRCEHFHALITEEINSNIWSLDNEMRNLTLATSAPIEHPLNLAFCETIEFEGVTKSQLDHACSVWMTETYKNPKAVLKLHNKQLGELFLQSNMPYKSSLPLNSGNTFGTISYNLHLQLQDNALSLSFYDFWHEASKPFGIIKKTDECLEFGVMKNASRHKNTCDEIKEIINVEVKRLQQSLLEIVNREGLAKSNNKHSDYLQYSDVVQVGTIQKDALFDKVNMWFALTFPGGRDQLEVRDKKNGDFILKSMMYYNPPILKGKIDSRGYISYALRIQTEKDQFKYMFDKFVHQASPPNGTDYGNITTDDKCYQPFSIFTDTENSILKNCEILKQAIDENVTQVIEDLTNYVHSN